MNTPKNDVYAEAPASWNTRYITPEGFECQLTLRGETGQEVLDKAQGATAFLLTAGCTPSAITRSRTNAQPDHNGQAQSDGNGNGRSWCPIHQCEMKRWEKDGRAWYSHKVDGQWCSGKAKRNAQAS